MESTTNNNNNNNDASPVIKSNCDDEKSFPADDSCLSSLPSVKNGSFGQSVYFCNSNQTVVSDQLNYKDKLPHLSPQNLLNQTPEKQTALSKSQTKMDENEVEFSKPSKRAYLTVIILFFVNLLNYMDRFTVAAVLFDIQNDYGMDDAESGLLQTVFICSYMIFAPIFGYLGDRHSRKRIMVAGILIWSGSVLVSSFIPKTMVGLFFFCRALVGIGEASYSTVASTLIADLFTKDHRSRMLMVFYFAIPIGSGLGFMVGSSVASLFADHSVGWRWGVRVTPIFGIICLLLLIFVLKEPKRGEAERGSGSGGSKSTWIGDVTYLFRNRSFVWSTMGFTCVAFASGCLSWWVVNLVTYSESMTFRAPDKATIGLIFGVITCVAGFAGVMIGSFAAQFWRRRNPRADPLVCGIGILLSVPFLYFALTVLQYNQQITWVMVFFAVLCLSLNWAIVSDILMYIVPPTRRSTASALQILFSHLLGDAASPYIIGEVSDAIRGTEDSSFHHFMGLKYAMYIPAFVLVLGGFFFLCTAWYVVEDRKASEAYAKLSAGAFSPDRNYSSNSFSEQSQGSVMADNSLMSNTNSSAYLISPDESDDANLRLRF